AYGSAVIYTPLLIYLLSGAGVDMWFLFRTIFLLIVVPFILSRFIVNLEWKIFKYNKYAANVLFAMLFYIIIGTNYSRIVGDFVSLIPLFVIMFVLSFVLGIIVYYIVLKLKKDVDEAALYSFFATFKNTGAAAAIAFVVFGPAASLPLAVRALFSPFLIVFMRVLVERRL
ncbi:hypothetical protein KY311_03605, partial [Candidatus Woesearchaeota archaeon]|nr:hypothetical protein [Candidatus Woesearchaeota archaeon]